MSSVVNLVEIDRSLFPAWKALRIELYRALDDDYHDREMDQVRDHPDWHCRLIEIDGAIAGFFELSSRNIVDNCLSSPVAYLEGLYLKPEYRGRGYGREVLSMVIDWCRARGYTELATDTELANRDARTFYEESGFTETERIVQFRRTLD